MSAMARLWHERTPAERKVAGVIGALSLFAVFAAFVWLPLERMRTRLSTQVPALHASIAQLERQAEEVRRLKTIPPAVPGAREPLASIATAAGGRSLPGAQISVLDGKRITVTGADVAFGALLEWLSAVQGRQGLRVDKARIEALPVAGRVRAELQLSRN